MNIDQERVAFDIDPAMHDSQFIKVWGDAGGGTNGRIALAKYAYQAARAALVVEQEPVASIDSEAFENLACGWINEATRWPGKHISEMATWTDLVQHIDAHCAAHCAAQVAQALAAKPALSDAEIEAMVVWMGDSTDPYFDRIAFARSVLAAIKGTK
jgi:hypothetical protein